MPEELTVGQFVYIISQRLHLSPGQALFVFVGNALPPICMYQLTAPYFFSLVDILVPFPLQVSCWVFTRVAITVKSYQKKKKKKREILSVEVNGVLEF